MSEPSSITIDTPLEHFELIEDVIAHIRTKLPAESGPGSWKAVCEDVLHCQLPAVEPILLRELDAAQGNTDEQSKIRALLRAVSWYRHPPKNAEELVTEIQHLHSTHPGAEDHAAFAAVEEALKNQSQGAEALQAADAIDQLFARAQNDDHKGRLRQIRDQIYYQLLYPHWFEVVKHWVAARSASL